MRKSAFAAVWLVLAAVVLTLAGVSARERQAPEPSSGEEDVTRRVDREVERTLQAFGDRGAHIGVSIRDIEPADSAAVTGAQVEDVRDDSPAARAGIRKGDVITQFDGERVRSARQLSRLVAETPPGRTVGLKLMRAGRQMDVQVTPEEGARIAGRFGRQMRVMPQFRFEVPEGGYGRMIPPGELRLWSGGRARLGVSIQGMTSQLAEYFGAKEGVLVTTVREDSAAEKAGLRAGDVITAVNGQPVTSPADLTRAIREAKETAKVSYVRDRKTAEVEVSLPTPEERQRRRSTRPA